MSSSTDRENTVSTSDEPGDRPTVEERNTLSPLTRWPLAVFSGVVTVFLLVINGRYGYVPDEQYMLAAGKFYLDWGYMDQQPLVPFVAWLIDAVFPGSLVALRIPAILVTVLGIWVTALTAREFGGDRRAQILSAAAYPLAVWLLLSGHWFTAATVEPLLWATIIWLLVRWVRLNGLGEQRDSLLVWAGVVIALAIQTKFQIFVLCAALVAGVAISGPRVLFRRPGLWIGVGIAVVTAIPTLVWQAANGWPALEMSAVVGQESRGPMFIPGALVNAGAGVGALLCCYGLWQLFRAPVLKPYRFLGWTVALTTVFFVVFGGRSNYLAGFYALLYAAGAIGLQQRRLRSANPRRWGWVAWPVYAASAIFPITLMPIYSEAALAENPNNAPFHRINETGWPELASATARAYLALPPDQRARTVVVAETFQLASAIDVQGRAMGIPRAYSQHRGYWYFGGPPADADTVLFVGKGTQLDKYFSTKTRLGSVQTTLDNMSRGNLLTLYSGPVKPWAELWPEIRTTQMPKS